MNYLSMIKFLLEQNVKEKSETYLGVCVLAIFGCLFIIGLFGKSGIPSKTFKKTHFFFACLSIFVFVILFISSRNYI